MSDSIELALQTIIDESQQIVDALDTLASGDQTVVFDIDELKPIQTSREQHIKALFESYSGQELAIYPDSLKKIQTLDLELVEKSKQIKSNMEQKVGKFKMNKKAVSSYGKY